MRPAPGLGNERRYTLIASVVGGPRRYPRAMIAVLRNWARIVLTPVHLRRTLLIAFVIGSWLNLFNHGDELLHGMMSAPLAAKLALNYLTPFVVSNIGLLARQRR